MKLEILNESIYEEIFEKCGITANTPFSDIKSIMFSRPRYEGDGKVFRATNYQIGILLARLLAAGIIRLSYLTHYSAEDLIKIEGFGNGRLESLMLILKALNINLKVEDSYQEYSFPQYEIDSIKFNEIDFNKGFKRLNKQQQVLLSLRMRAHFVIRILIKEFAFSKGETDLGFLIDSSNPEELLEQFKAFLEKMRYSELQTFIEEAYKYMPMASLDINTQNTPQYNLEELDIEALANFIFQHAFKFKIES